MRLQLSVAAATALLLMGSQAWAVERGMGVASVHRSTSNVAGSGGSVSADFSSRGFKAGARPGAIGFTSANLGNLGKGTYDENIRTGGGKRNTVGIGRSPGAIANKTRPLQNVRGIGSGSGTPGGLGI